TLSLHDALPICRYNGNCRSLIAGLAPEHLASHLLTTLALAISFQAFTRELRKRMRDFHSSVTERIGSASAISSSQVSLFCHLSIQSDIAPSCRSDSLHVVE